SIVAEGRRKSRSSSDAGGAVLAVLRSPTSMPTDRATISAFSSWQLGLPDSSSTIKRSPVPERAASSACVQPMALLFCRIEAPKSRADLNIDHSRGDLPYRKIPERPPSCLPIGKSDSLILNSQR